MTFIRLTLQKPEISAGSNGPLRLVKGFSFILVYLFDTKRLYKKLTFNFSLISSADGEEFQETACCNCSEVASKASGKIGAGFICR